VKTKKIELKGVVLQILVKDAFKKDGDELHNE